MSSSNYFSHSTLVLLSSAIVTSLKYPGKNQTSSRATIVPLKLTTLVPPPLSMRKKTSFPKWDFETHFATNLRFVDFMIFLGRLTSIPTQSMFVPCGRLGGTGCHGETLNGPHSNKLPTCSSSGRCAKK